MSGRILDNPPNARKTMEALRELGYDSYASVLDIADNCIDAQATKIGELYTDLAKESYKPLEGIMAKVAPAK